MGRRQVAGRARPGPSGGARARRSRGRGALLPFGLLAVPVLILALLSGGKDPSVAPAPASRDAVPTAQPVALRSASPDPAPAPLVPAAFAAPAPVVPVRMGSPAPIARAAGEVRYVAGRGVPLRAEPQDGGAILDRYGPGQSVEVLGRSGPWTHVRHTLTRREGWVQARRLRDAPPEPEAGGGAAPETRAAKAAPAADAAAIAKLLIARSIAAYPGPCACPYQSARNGSSCGKRAAYLRPGGYAPLCYAKDITPGMIAAYRAER